MPDPQASAPRLSAFALVRRLVSGLVGLAKLEVQHGIQELGGMMATARIGLIYFAIAFALVFGALMSLTVFLILALAALLGWPGWVMSLVVTVLLLGIAAVLVWRGIRRVRAIRPPEETIASVKEEVEWAKRLLRRG